MPRATAKKNKSLFSDETVWTIAGAYVVGMVVALLLQGLTLLPSQSRVADYIQPVSANAAAAGDWVKP